MQFQVPQFIEIEAKIVGPLTLKQSVYVGGAVALGVFFYFTLSLPLFIFLTILTAALALALAFIKYNGQPMPKIIGAAFSYFWNPRFYVWRAPPAVIKPIVIPKIPKGEGAPRTGLKELLFKLTTTTKNLAEREKNFRLSSLVPGGAKERFEVLRKASGERSAARRIDYS